MTKMDILYNRIIALTMVLSVVSIVFLIIDLFYAVGIQAIDCSGQVCKIDHAFPLIRISVWFFLVLAIVSLIISRVLLQLLSKKSELEDASAYKSRLHSEKESAKLIESKLKELAEAKEKKEEELRLKRLEEKAIQDAKDELIEKEIREKLIAKAKRDEQLKEEKLKQERLRKEKLEQERLEQERLEQEKLEQEKLEQDKLKEEASKIEDEILVETIFEDESLKIKDEPVIEEKPLVKDEPKAVVVTKPTKAAKPKETKKTKADIIEYIEQDTGISKNKSNKFLKFFAQVVKESLADGKDVDIPGFGKFTTIEMPAKKAMNPQTNKEIIVPTHNQARLRFDDKFKTLVESIDFDEPKVIEEKIIKEKIIEEQPIIIEELPIIIEEPLTEDELVLVDKAVIESKPVVKEKPKVISSKPIKPKESKKTKADIIEYIEVETGISKNKSNKFLKFFAQVVKETLAEGKDVDIPGFGKFTTIEMPAKKAMNPQTNEEIIVPAHNQARLRFDDIFKDKFEVK